MSPSEYDEQQAVEDYICKFYRKYLTPIETRGILMTNGGVYPEGSPQAKKADRLAGPIENIDELKAALSDGVDAIRTRATNRILAEHADEVRFNRCSKCERIVRTPLAKQCLWCGHDWH